MKILIDLFNIFSGAADLIVRDDADYIIARKQILSFKRNKRTPYTVHVNQNPYINWFRDLEGETDFEYLDIKPLIELQKKFPDSYIDKALKDHDIIILGLLKSNIEPTEVSLLKYFIGDFIYQETVLSEKIFNCCLFLTKFSKEFESSDYLQKKLKTFITTLNIPGPTGLKLADKLMDWDQEFAKLFSELLYMSQSKLAFDAFFETHLTYFETALNSDDDAIKKFIKSLAFKSDLSDVYEVKLVKFFKDLYQDVPSAFFTNTDLSIASLKAFISFKMRITDAQKADILERFGNKIDNLILQKIESLVVPTLLPPPDVTGLDVTGQSNAWKEWSKTSYIPYKFFIDEFAVPEAEISIAESYANQFSEWLLANYSLLTNIPGQTNYDNIRHIHELLDQKSVQVIWLIIDGFPLAYQHILEQILKENGINGISLKVHVAAIPTITQIGIPTQLSGRYQNSINGEVDRKNLLRSAFPNKEVLFTNKISEFLPVLSEDADVYCLHWLEIDAYMHKEDHQIEGSRSNEIQRLLDIRIGQISKAIRQKTKKTILVLSADHGITKCLIKGRKIKNSALNALMEDHPKERCVAITTALKKAIHDPEEVYNLPASFTNNSGDWVSAKGYRYFGRFDYGYRHGGLTPEESLVPFVIAQPVAFNFKKPAISLVGKKLYRVAFTEEYELLIRNDNDTVIKLDTLLFGEHKHFINGPVSISASSTIRITGQFKLPKATSVINDTTQVNLKVSFTCSGVQEDLIISLSVPVEKDDNDALENLLF